MRPKKQLGQNFLTRDYYAKVMCDAADVNENDLVVEVGPGKGILTEILLLRAKKVLAIEKDTELIKFLEERFRPGISKNKLEIISGDAREFETKKLPPYKVVANIPYYITGEIVRHFLTSEKQPKSITLMVQKEVADRIIARDGKESLLSISVKTYGKPEIIARVNAGNFYPKPKVDSAVLHIKNISKTFFEDVPEEKFFQILRAGFSHKRKVLVGNLAEFGKDRLTEGLQKIKISLKTRAENLSANEWKMLSKHLT